MILTRRAFDPHTIKLVIFDLDGTLIDSRLDLVHSVNAALRHIGRVELPDDVIASYVGDGAPILIQRALGGEHVDEALLRGGLDFFLSYYREHKLDHTTVYTGIDEALRTIQNAGNGAPRKMAVLTNKPVCRHGRSWKRSGWASIFARFTAETVLPPKSLTLKALVNFSPKMACFPDTPRSSATPTPTSRPGATRGYTPSASPTGSLLTH